jgi:hypothetical protein
MIDSLHRSDVADLRAMFDSAGYNEDELQAKTGGAAPPAPHEVQARLHSTREVTAQNALVRLFLLGVTLDRSAATEALPETFIELAVRTGLLIEEDDRLVGSVVIVPVGLFFAYLIFDMIQGWALRKRIRREMKERQREARRNLGH